MVPRGRPNGAVQRTSNSQRTVTRKTVVTLEQIPVITKVLRLHGSHEKLGRHGRVFRSLVALRMQDVMPVNIRRRYRPWANRPEKTPSEPTCKGSEGKDSLQGTERERPEREERERET